MLYGCIGERLSHSFSKEIHALLTDYEYELCEIPREELAAFMIERPFRAINVTIPYKQAVIPYLCELSPEAAAIGAVNTVVNRDGRLFGYNTDFFGICASLARLGIRSLTGKKVLILGTGGTSRTARAVARHLGAETVLTVSRTPDGQSIGYDEATTLHADAQILFNTTPVGMYPRIGETPIDLSAFPHLEAVFDAVYNPLRTRLVQDAAARGIPSGGGLYMLVAQARAAAGIFLGQPLTDEQQEYAYARIRADKENLVLIGMPACGKTTLGRALAERLGRDFLDLDEALVRSAGKSIPEIFAAEGEEGFRRREAALIAEAAGRTRLVIATGGGAILREENVRALQQNGRLIFLDRPLSMLIPTEDRPTAHTAEQMAERYRERYPLYMAAADLRISIDGDASTNLERILQEICK